MFYQNFLYKMNSFLIEADNKEDAFEILKKSLGTKGLPAGMTSDNLSEINMDEVKSEGCECNIYPHYIGITVEKIWDALYGCYKIHTKPKMAIEPDGSLLAGDKRFVGKLSFNTIEEYAQFLVDSIYVAVGKLLTVTYSDGRKKAFKQTTQREKSQTMFHPEYRDMINEIAGIFHEKAVNYIYRNFVTNVSTIKKGDKHLHVILLGENHEMINEYKERTKMDYVKYKGSLDNYRDYKFSEEHFISVMKKVVQESNQGD